MSDTLEWLGAGFGLRRPHLQALQQRRERGEALPRVLELTPSHWFARPELIDEIAEQHAIVLHDLLASLGTAGPIDREHLGRVASFARRCGAIAYSEHLAMTRSPGGLELGHLIPLPRTHAQLELLVDHVHALQDALALPIAIELPATTLALPGAELDEGEFVTALIDRSGCGLHLDLDNLRVDAVNELRAGDELVPGVGAHASASAAEHTLELALTEAGVPPALGSVIARRLVRLPLDAVTRLHLAGGHLDAEGWAVDSHRAPVSALTYAMLAALRGRVRPRAIIIERDDRLPPVAELVEQAERAQALWLAPEGSPALTVPPERGLLGR